MGGQLLQIGGLAACVLVALLFLAAGIDKLRHRELLPGVIANYRLLPEALVAPAAWLLPPVELAVAAGLLIGPLAGIGPLLVLLPVLAAAGLLLLFAAAMAINIGRGRRHIDCGCGHAGLRQQLGWGQVLRNIALVAGLAMGLAVPSAPGLGGAELAMAMISGLVGWLLLLLFQSLRGLAGTGPGQVRG
jgi:hypothetical protein